NRRRILRTPSFEEFCDARQAARDVACLVCLTRDLGDRFASMNLLAVVGNQHRPHWDNEVSDLLFLSDLRRPDLDVRMRLLLAVLDDDALTQTGELVELLGVRLVLDEVN